jgi:hypothetical protein
LIEELGIEVERNGEFANRGALAKLGPSIPDKEHFGEDRRWKRPPPVPEFLRKRRCRTRPPRSDSPLTASS